MLLPLVGVKNATHTILVAQLYFVKKAAVIRNININSLKDYHILNLGACESCYIFYSFSKTTKLLVKPSKSDLSQKKNNK